MRAELPLEGWTFDGAPHAPGAPGRPAKASRPSRIPRSRCPPTGRSSTPASTSTSAARGWCASTTPTASARPSASTPTTSVSRCRRRRFSVSAEMRGAPPLRRTQPRRRTCDRARLILFDPELAEFALLAARSSIDTADELGAHEVVAAADRRRRGRPGAARLADRDRGLCRAGRARRTRRSGSGSCRATSTPSPAGLDDAPARHRSSPRPRACSADLRDAPRPLSADRRAGADRPRPYRPRLAVAARRDPAQGRPHLLDHDRPDGPLSRLPLQPVDRPALRLSRGGRPGAPRRDQGEGRRPASGSRSAACGSSPTPTCRPASPSAASSSTASAISRRCSASRHTVCWLPDCFGFSPALPQILSQAGIDSFFTIKVNWSETNTMPYDLFWWEGLDGSRVLAHTFNNPVGGYNAETGAARRRRDLAELSAASTPTPKACSPSAMATAAAARPRRCSSASASSPISRSCPSLRPVKVADWFAEVHAKRRGRRRPAGLGRRDVSRAPPRHADDAGPHQVPAPAGRARPDHGRDAVEHGDAARRPDRAVARGALARAAPQRVPRHPARLRASARSTRRPRASSPASSPPASAVSADQLAAIAGKLVRAGRHARRARRQSRPLAAAAPPRCRRTRCPAARPSRAAACSPATAPVPGLAAAVIVDAGSRGRPLGRRPTGSRTRFLRVEIAADGTLASVFDKRAGREALAGRGNQIWAYVDKPRNWDAWDIEEDYAAPAARRSPPTARSKSSSAARTAPRSASRAASATARSSRPSGSGRTRPGSSSRPTSTGTIAASCSRRASRSRSAPTSPPSNAPTASSAAPTHRNTSWDVRRASRWPAHRFADLSEQGYGVALLNDGKYGHHALGNELGLSLLRSPVYPDPLADEGGQSFTYALYPHAGDWLTGGVLAEAEDLNQPLLATPVKADAESTWTAVDGRRAAARPQRLQAGRGRRAR